MLVVSDSIKNAYSKYTTQRKSYIQVGNNSFFVQNLDVSADTYLEGNVIGNAIAKIAKFDIETVNVSGIDEFELFDGIWTGNQYEYISLGTFKLFNEEGTDDFFSSITAYDKLVLFNKEYNPSQTTYPTTLYSLLQNICSQAGVELENTSIPNGSQPIASNSFVENETLKNVLNAISQISGNYAIISKDKLKLLLKGTQTINLNKSQISNPEYKRTTWKINQVVLGMSDVEGEYVLRQDDADIEMNGVHKLVINDNPFVYTQELREAYIDNLFNQVKGFGYTAFDTQWEGLPYVELGDLLNFDGKESLVLRYNLKSPDGLKSTLSAPSIIDSVVEYVDNSNSIKNRQKRTEILVDKQNGQIESLVNRVQDLTDFLKTIEGLDEIILENTVDSNGAIGKLELSGFTEMNLYPGMTYSSNNVYPNKLTAYTIIQENEDGTEYNETYIDLGISLIETDKLIIDNNKVSIKRINGNIDTDLEVILKTFEGKTKIRVKYFENINIKCLYIEKNDFTKYFATQTELQSQILITDEGISSKVSKAELISEINQSPEQITLTSNRLVVESNGFTLDGEGNMTATSGKIGGFVIDEYQLYGLHKKIDNPYTEEDLTNIRNYITGNGTLNDYQLQFYDYNNDGKVNGVDYVSISNLIEKGKKEYTVELNSKYVDKMLNIYDENNATTVKLGANGGEFSELLINDSLTFGNSISGFLTSITDTSDTFLFNFDGTKSFGQIQLNKEIGNNSETTIQFEALTGNINCASVTQYSTYEKKKNFERLENALDIIKNTDIYKYNLKTQEDNEKKHIGFVIGDNYNYSQEITSNENDGVDVYSMVSVCFKAIQEQQEQIENLKNEINQLKEMIK